MLSRADGDSNQYTYPYSNGSAGDLQTPRIARTSYGRETTRMAHNNCRYWHAITCPNPDLQHIVTKCSTCDDSN